MRPIIFAISAAVLLLVVPAKAQRLDAPLTIQPQTPPAAQQIAPEPGVPGTTQPQAQTPADGGLRVEWEVKNRFRLFRSEADFQRQVAASRADGVLAAEDRLESETDGRGWARTVVGRLCTDSLGKIVETCERDGERENYLNPVDHRIGVLLGGTVPAGSRCSWTFNDGSGPAQQVSVPCEEEVRLRVRYGRPTLAIADVALADGTALRTSGEIMVRDVLIAGLGDSIAAGEGNPDRPVALDDGGFCFRRFFGGGRSEYFRPGRAGYKGDKACDPTTRAVDATGPAIDSAREWQRTGAHWSSAACHRSLYSYQTRTALALAIENPHLAITFIPLACTGATVEAGLLGSQSARECNPDKPNCSGNVPGQIGQLKAALAQAAKRDRNRKLDLVLLTVGANDIYFSGLVADVILQGGTERTLFEQNGITSEVEDAQEVLNGTLPQRFIKLRAALKPLVGGKLARVVFVSYGNPALSGPRTACAGGRDGFDVHPAFSADPEKLREVASFVTEKFLPRMRALALCEGGVLCRDPASDRMTFVDNHRDAFAQHGFCARAQTDPAFDRQCFSAKGQSFVSEKATASQDPLTCGEAASEFRPYAPRARWIRTANDSYFTAMTYPADLPASMKPSDIHDATWGAASAVYGGAIHPTAEGQAAMADAALPAVRDVLGLQQDAQNIKPAPLAAPGTENLLAPAPAAVPVAPAPVAPAPAQRAAPPLAAPAPASVPRPVAPAPAPPVTVAPPVAAPPLAPAQQIPAPGDDAEPPPVPGAPIPLAPPSAPDDNG